MRAEIMKVKGGASAIATMTFDDGHPRTSRKLNELLPKYNAKASLMLYCRKSLANGDEIALWRDVLSEGHLSAENHSMTHDYLTSNPNYTKPEHLTEEKYILETRDARDRIRDAFPGQDVLAFTIPYANYVPDARRHVIATQYSALAGECVLTDPDNEGLMQSLDPSFADPETGVTPAGCWHNVYYARLQPIYSVPRVDKGETKAIYPQLSMDNILGYLDRCVKDGGWFLTSCHGIYQGENQDLTEEELEMLLSRMASYGDRLWIATYTDATKYLRERQNSTLTEREEDGITYLDLTMKRVTSDGLPLTDEIFNMPLTVRVDTAPDCEEVEYTQAGKTCIVKTRTEDGRRFAYLELVPNGGESKIIKKKGRAI